MPNKTVREIDPIANDPAIKQDRMRFTKNRVPALLAYLGIVFNVLYFIFIYKTNHSYFYNGLIGISVITNLIVLLASFLCSEGIKNYKWKYGVAMCAIAVLQIVRIFIYPMQAYNTYIEETESYVIDMPELIPLIIFLVGSAASMAAGGVIGILRSKKLEKYLASREQAGKEVK